MAHQRGFTLIEVMVALCLFAISAAALAETLMTAQRMRASSARWGRALGLAEDRLERLRGGDRSDDAAPLGELTRSWHREAFDHDPALDRVEVRVDWKDHGDQRLTLHALLPRD